MSFKSSKAIHLTNRDICTKRIAAREAPEAASFLTRLPRLTAFCLSYRVHTHEFLYRSSNLAQWHRTLQASKEMGPVRRQGCEESASQEQRKDTDHCRLFAFWAVIYRSL